MFPKNARYLLNQNHIFLVLIPLLILCVGILLLNTRGMAFLLSVDCKYAYLYNGLNMGNLRFNLGHIDHPGTPIQLVYALSSRIAHLFTGKGNPYTLDVVANSEKYIFITMYCLIVLNSLIIFMIGRLGFIFSRNIYMGLLSQGGILLSKWTALISYSSNPEMFSDGVLLLGVIALGYVKNKIPPNRLAFIFSVCCAFLLSLKITFGAFILIPLISIPKLKGKLLFILYLLVFYAIFAFPVVIQPEKYFNWLIRIVLHDGSYGTGEKTFLNADLFFLNLSSLWGSDFKIYFILNMFAIVTVILFVFTREKNSYQKKILTIIVSIVAANTILLFFVLKQYSTYYVLPSSGLSVFILIFIYLLLRSKYPQHIKPVYFRYFVILFLVVFTLKFILVSVNKHSSLKQGVSLRKQTLHKVMKFNKDTGMVKIIVPTYLGAPLPEYAHFFGVKWSGRDNEKFYCEQLNKIYPYSYIYKPDAPDFIFHWLGNTNFRDVFCLGKDVLLYIDGGEKVESLIFENLRKIGLSYDDFELYFDNRKTGERVFLYENRDSVQCIPTSEIHLTADFEFASLKEGKLFLSDSAHFTKFIHHRLSKKHVISGKTSLLMQSENNFTPLVRMKYHRGITLRVSAYIFPEKAPVISVIAPINHDGFYSASSSFKNINHNWKLTEHHYTLPEVTGIDSIAIYLWNIENTAFYVDNMEIIMESYE